MHHQHQVESGALSPRTLSSPKLLLREISIDSWWKVYLAGILCLAAILRLSSLSLIEFRHDSAYWALDAYDILEHHTFPLAGQQVGSVAVELYNGPLLSYITALGFLTFGYRPEFVAAIIAGLNVIGVFVTFQLGKELYSRRVGLIAATLMCVSPWLVLYGRMLWPQSMFPFLVPLSMLVLARAIRNDSMVQYLLFGAILGIGLQLHLSVMALIGTGILLVLAYSRRKRSILVTGGGVVLGYIPIVVNDLLHGFPNLRALIQLPALHSGDESRIEHYAKTIWNFSNVLSGQGLWVSKIGDSPYLPGVIDWGQGVLFGLTFALALVMIGRTYLIRETRHHLPRISYQDAIVLGYVLLPAAYLFLSRSSIERHYFIFLYPAPFLIVARGLQLWTERHDGPSRQCTYLRRAVPGALAVACILNLVTLGYAYSFSVERGGVAAYGTTLSDKQGAVTFIRAHSRGNFEVDIQGVQESLPYVFLFQRGEPVVLDGSDEFVVAIASADTHDKPLSYRIVERAYHDDRLRPGEHELFRVRGVVVIGSDGTGNQSTLATSP